MRELPENRKVAGLTPTFISHNVKGTPTYFLIDREGKIVAKDIPMKRLGSAIDDLLKK